MIAAGVRGRSDTKPGTLLKSQIPIRTWADWDDNRPVKNKAAVWVFEALEWVIARLAFAVIGIDSRNGSEFINNHLFNYCAAHKITFARSRSGHSNDGAHVEYKNWTHVRGLVGYLRCYTPEDPTSASRGP